MRLSSTLRHDTRLNPRCCGATAKPGLQAPRSPAAEAILIDPDSPVPIGPPSVQVSEVTVSPDHWSATTSSGFAKQRNDMRFYDLVDAILEA
jgi:hypothetical protein